MFARNVVRVARNTAGASRAFSSVSGANVEVVSEVSCIQPVDLEEGGGSRSFLGRVTQVGPKVKDLKVDDYVLPADQKVRADGYSNVVAGEGSFLKVDDGEWLDPLVGATLASTPSAALHILSTVVSGSTFLSVADHGLFSMDLVRMGKAKGCNVVCAVDDCRSRAEYTKAVNVLYNAGADVVVPLSMVGSATYHSVLESIEFPSTLIHGSDFDEYAAEFAAFKKAKGFSARKSLLEDYARSGVLAGMKVSKGLGAGFSSEKRAVIKYDSSAGLANHDWMKHCKAGEVKSILQDALNHAPLLDYEFDHCQEQDIGADFVKSNYRDGNFERAVVMSVDGEDMPDIALKKKKSQVAQAIINELSVVDPLHPLVMEAEQEMFLREDTEVNRTKGSAGFYGAEEN
eukprot:g322.t1